MNDNTSLVFKFVAQNSAAELPDIRDISARFRTQVDIERKLGSKFDFRLADPFCLSDVLHWRFACNRTPSP